MKVVLIEDNEKLVQHLKKTLEAEGITVEYYTKGRDGQSYVELNHGTIDLIILDLMLPDIGGINLCKSIRYQKINTPILVLSAKSTLDDKVMGLDAGADDYLAKPFSVKELFARIRALTRRQKTLVPTVIVLNEISINTSTRKVVVNKKEVNLTLKEFGLLEYFMKHPNQVVSRDIILDRFWDSSFDSFSNVIDVHIKNLRRKLNAPHKKSLLETVRGVGYRLRA